MFLGCIPKTTFLKKQFGKKTETLFTFNGKSFYLLAKISHI